ncbi:MAG TPA: EAL domain-containing protein [Thermoanaerobaculia bacterium]|nr:EAL domain-containing protein [Thermoanaerobaculia bacterium]
MFGAGRLWNQIVEPTGLTTSFQPIFEIGWGGRSVFALEALTRGPRGTNVERSDVLFEYVRRKRREAEIDRLAIAAALREARGFADVPGLSLNVHASTLEQDRLLPVWLAEQAQEYGIPCHRLIVEIVEHAPPWSGPAFLMSLDRLRGLGVRIALDDVGLGQSNFRMILDCQPDLLKIDRHFVDGAHSDAHRRAVLESIADLACRLGGRAVAEGIEDERDLDVVLSAGIDLVQGYLLCSPYPGKSLRKLDFMQDIAGPLPALEDRPFEDKSPTQEILLPG